MPYWRLFYHVTWCVLGREPLLPQEWRQRVYVEIERQARAGRAVVYAVGGVDDHVHVVLSIPPAVAVADVVRRMKGGSAH